MSSITNYLLKVACYRLAHLNLTQSNNCANYIIKLTHAKMVGAAEAESALLHD